MSTTTPTRDFDAIVIGAGFSGLAMLHYLRQVNLSAVVLEAGSGVGGTGYWNTYPGARTDSEFSYYSFSFSKEVREEWRWSERYPSQPEVQAYLEFLAERSTSVATFGSTPPSAAQSSTRTRPPGPSASRPASGSLRNT